MYIKCLIEPKGDVVGETTHPCNLIYTLNRCEFVAYVRVVHELLKSTACVFV